MWMTYNPNPMGARVGDCVIRAISKATNQSWHDTYIDLAIYGLKLCDILSANHVWGQYLRDRGYVRKMIPNTCPNCYTVKDFCKEHPNGTYILALSGHVVCIRDGDYYDSWDSGNEVPIYYWQEEKS